MGEHRWPLVPQGCTVSIVSDTSGTNKHQSARPEKEALNIHRVIMRLSESFCSFQAVLYDAGTDVPSGVTLLAADQSRAPCLKL